MSMPVLMQCDPIQTRIVFLSRFLFISGLSSHRPSHFKLDITDTKLWQTRPGGLSAKACLKLQTYSSHFKVALIFLRTTFLPPLPGLLLGAFAM